MLHRPRMGVRNAAFLTAGVISLLLRPVGSLLPSDARFSGSPPPPPWKMAWVPCGMRPPSTAFMSIGDGEPPGKNVAEGRNKRPSIPVASFNTAKAARVVQQAGATGLRALSSSGLDSASEAGGGIPVKADQAEKELTPTELPKGLAEWVDRWDVGDLRPYPAHRVFLIT
jgi:hypothetical protein